MQFAPQCADFPYLRRAHAGDRLGDASCDLGRRAGSMLLHDGTAADALHAKADEARRVGAPVRDRAVLIGLPRTADPVTGP
jgi:hypothetical protein